MTDVSENYRTDATKHKFATMNRVEHVETKRVYVIVNTPDQVRLEDGVTPAYIYIIERPRGAPPVGEQEPRRTWWVRSQEQMEDGRFILLP